MDFSPVGLACMSHDTRRRQSQICIFVPRRMPATISREIAHIFFYFSVLIFIIVHPVSIVRVCVVCVHKKSQQMQNRRKINCRCIVHSAQSGEYTPKMCRRVCRGSRQIKSLLPILFALRCLHENVNIPMTTATR